MKESLKIRNSKGKLYIICPFISKIEKILMSENISLDSRFEIQRHLDSIQAIAEVYQGKCENNECFEKRRLAEPYNYEAVLKNIRQNIKNNSLTEEKLNEILELYL
jgi:hypothetical protein